MQSDGRLHQVYRVDIQQDVGFTFGADFRKERDGQFSP